jgi:hypothetical protein
MDKDKLAKLQAQVRIGEPEPGSTHTVHTTKGSPADDWFRFFLARTELLDLSRLLSLLPYSTGSIPSIYVQRRMMWLLLAPFIHPKPFPSHRGHSLSHQSPPVFP